MRAQSITDHNGELFSATSGPVATGDIVLANATPIYTTFNTAVTTVAATALVAGTTYVISVVGNTNWALVGAPPSFDVGTTFTATGAGTGTGTATLGGAAFPIVTIASA